MSPRRLFTICTTLLVAAVLVGVWALRHMHDDVRRAAGRIMGCPPEQIEVEVLESADVERYRVQGCGGGGIMSCEPTDALCFIVPEER